MTTNITPIQTLEKIKGIIELYFDNNIELKELDVKFKNALEIIDQALAPQEYDVSNCEFRDPIFQECHCIDDSAFAGEESDFIDGVTWKISRKCVDNLDCWFRKQLHSQERDMKKFPILEYFGEITDEGGGTIDYCILPCVSTRDIVEALCKFNKQLHSQEKTFTVEEIAKKINARIENLKGLRNCYYPETNPQRKRIQKGIMELTRILAEFEKECG